MATDIEATDDFNPPWKTLFYIVVSFSALFLAYRVYQHEMAFTVGLDYFEPEFQTYWMSILYIQLVLISVLGAAFIGWIWFTREKEKVLEISRDEELRRYLRLLVYFSAFGIVTFFATSLYTEADAAWHQVTIRDTDFTPTHIPLFYFAIPLLLASGTALFVWTHTRLPNYYGRISLPYLIVIFGPILIMPNLGYNEWGHTFFYAEELFAAPVHWGFVLLGWSIFFAGGLFLQIVQRVEWVLNGDDEGSSQNEEPGD